MSFPNTEMLNQPEELSKQLAKLAISKDAEDQATQARELFHRLDIFRSWFGDLQATQLALKGNNVVEIGCGQGDMTIAIAYFLSRSTAKVYAIDPGPLDYGSPHTLGQAQGHLSKSEIGPSIEWIQSDPLKVMSDREDVASAELFVVAHSSFYFESIAYLQKLFSDIAARSPRDKSISGKTRRLLFAEWGMRTSVPEAEPHLLAVQAQAIQPFADGNVRTVVPPDQVKALAQNRGWKIEREGWIECPGVDDGKWEVYESRKMKDENESINEGARKCLDEMEEKIAGLDGPVRSMDVWTCVFTVKL